MLYINNIMIECCMYLDKQMSSQDNRDNGNNSDQYHKVNDNHIMYYVEIYNVSCSIIAYAMISLAIIFNVHCVMYQDCAFSNVIKIIFFVNI